MIKELIDEIILKKRPEQITLTRYGNYDAKETMQATYNDKEQKYTLLETQKNKKEVHSKKAFLAYIKEELKRRENENGDFSTVHVTSTGGTFIADDKFCRGCCDYTRLYSEQYLTLQSYKDMVLDHEEFLTMLQKLKPSISNFAELYARCSKIRVVGRSQMTSQPIFDDEGNAESSFICTYKLEDGTDEDVSLPANFLVRIPFVKAGEIYYEYLVELLFYNTSSNKVAVKVQIPEWETNEEAAIIDEAEEIKTALSSMENLLVLADF